MSANGTINPVTLVSVGTQVSGTVKKLHVDFNSKVEKGQVLLELDDALLSAQQKQSLANVQNIQASLELADANEARARALFAKEYISRQELDSAVQAKKSAEAQLKLARAAVEKDAANLRYTIIRSPVSGVVVDRQVDVGQTVAASLQTPTLFKIAQDLSKMQIDANFAEADIGNIRVDQNVHFTVDAFPDRGFQGVVKQVRLNPINVQNVVTYDVVINVDNPEHILLPGLTTYVTIAVAERKNALLVPNAALRFKPAATDKLKPAASQPGASRPGREAFTGKVYLQKQGGLVPVTVTLGITDGRNTEVLNSDLKPGDQLVVGTAQATNGAPGHLANHVLHAHLAGSARLVHARLQDEDAGATVFARTDAVLASQATYRRADLELGAGLSRHELNVALQGDGAAVHAGGVLLADGRRHLDTRLGIVHQARDTRCELPWRGLADQRGRAVFHGGITIDAGADGSEAELSNKNLLLSDAAEIDTQPVLVIHADEVKAAHGATVGRLDETALFYLRSRGIPGEQARGLLVQAFLREPLAMLEHAALAETLGAAVAARLERKDAA